MKRNTTLVALLALALAAPARAQDVFTSFEFDDFSGQFTLGTPPFTVTFTDGLAQVIGDPALYVSGARAWMIPPGGIGEITFETPAEQLDFFFRDDLPTVQSVVTVYDTNGAVLASYNGTEVDWTHVVISAPDETTFIDRVTLAHNGPDGWTVIDDFAYYGVGGSGEIDGQILDPFPQPIRFAGPSVALQPIAAGMNAPNYGTGDPFGRPRLFVSDQSGVIDVINLTTGVRSPFLDVTGRLVELGIFGPGTFDERGLLGFAFHPGYQTNGLLYTYTSEPLDGPADHTTMPDGELANHQSVILEWHVPNPQDPASVVDPGSARELLRIDQPQFNHNGGCVAFGPDGLLYVALGDGGGADDRDGQDFIGGPIIGHGTGGNGQNMCNILGSIIRIDPLGNNSANGQYGIPADNPFTAVGDPSIDEIYAYGFRNPWRFSFDRTTGKLYVGDVGQNDVEEVDRVVLGGNYGWNFREGSFFFDHNGDQAGFITTNDSGGPMNVIDPIGEYDHDEGISVIGGFVYRGTALTGLTGRYIFGDWSRDFLGNNGRLFSLRLQGPPNHISEIRIIGQGSLGLSLHGFAQDANGELYVLGNTTGTPSGGTGVVFKLVPRHANPGSIIP